MTVVDVNTDEWGEPPFDSSIYHFAISGLDIGLVEQRASGSHHRINLLDRSLRLVRPGDVQRVFGEDPAKTQNRLTLSAIHFREELVATVFGDPHLDGLEHVIDPVSAGLLNAAMHLDEKSDPLLVDHVSLAVLHRIRGLRPQRDIRSKGRIERCLKFINDHLDQKLTLAELADTAAMSSYHFVRTFKQVTGITPLAYVTGKRIERAKGLMASPKLPMATISLMCGFSSQSQFSTAFKRHAGLSPMEYRRVLRGAA